MMSFGSFVVGYALVDTVGTITCIGLFGCCLMWVLMLAVGTCGAVFRLVFGTFLIHFILSALPFD